MAGLSRRTERRIQEARKALEDLGFPRAQVNERSALTLLALLGLKPGDPWRKADAPLMGITPMMEFFAVHYGKRYAPNTRETVRRRTVHQFVQAALALPNPDVPFDRGRHESRSRRSKKTRGIAVSVRPLYGGPRLCDGVRDTARDDEVSGRDLVGNGGVGRRVSHAPDSFQRRAVPWAV